MPDWRWDPGAGRYRDARGRFFSRAAALADVDQSIQLSSNVVRDLAGMVANGKISSTDWLDLMRNEVKDEFIRQYLDGVGGRAMMTPQNWGDLGYQIGRQYNYLNRFANDLEGLSEAQIQARAQLYSNASRQAYWKAKERVAQRIGVTYERWVLGIAEHCDDCIARDARGWVPFGTWGQPGDGTTQCLTNCKCHKEFMNAEGDTIL